MHRCRKPREPNRSFARPFSKRKEAIMPKLRSEDTVVHVRIAGRSLDVGLNELEIGASSDDRTIKHALSRRLDVPEHALIDYVVDRHETGNLTIRPSAVFG
jgi:hypothetical protein